MYMFNRHVIRRRFCKICGIHPYAEGIGEDGKRMVAVNIRCLEGSDPESVTVQNYDGKSI